MSEGICAVYILTNKRHTVLYTGVTVDLVRRVSAHRQKLEPHCFTARYNVGELVYFETFDHIVAAITREKQIKAGSRHKKLKLIESINPAWRDLFVDLV